MTNEEREENKKKKIKAVKVGEISIVDQAANLQGFIMYKRRDDMDKNPDKVNELLKKEDLIKLIKSFSDEEKKEIFNLVKEEPKITEKSKEEPQANKDVEEIKEIIKNSMSDVVKVISEAMAKSKNEFKEEPKITEKSKEEPQVNLTEERIKALETQFENFSKTVSISKAIEVNKEVNKNVETKKGTFDNLFVGFPNKEAR
jgi:DNA-binding transcriptional ArsR family regulator